MVKMKAEFTKEEVAYTIEADNSSGNTFKDTQEFKLAVDLILYETDETLESKKESQK